MRSLVPWLGASLIAALAGCTGHLEFGPSLDGPGAGDVATRAFSLDARPVDQRLEATPSPSPAPQAPAPDGGSLPPDALFWVPPSDANVGPASSADVPAAPLDAAASPPASAPAPQPPAPQPPAPAPPAATPPATAPPAPSNPPVAPAPPAVAPTPAAPTPAAPAPTPAAPAPAAPAPAPAPAPPPVTPAPAPAAPPAAPAPAPPPSVVVACPAGFDVPALLVQRCGGCHSAAAPAKGLDLVTAGAGRRMVNVRSGCGSTLLIAPTNPPGGHLMDKLAGPVAGCGSQMPSVGAPLTDIERACVSNWAAEAIRMNTTTTAYSASGAGGN